MNSKIGSTNISTAGNTITGAIRNLSDTVLSRHYKDVSTGSTYQGCTIGFMTATLGSRWCCLYIDVTVTDASIFNLQLTQYLPLTYDQRSLAVTCVDMTSKSAKACSLRSNGEVFIYNVENAHYYLTTSYPYQV